jgi:hypothetical protein
MTDTVHTPTFRPTLTEAQMVDLCERQIATKVVALLPLDEETAMRVLDLAFGLYKGFLSSEAVSSGGVFLTEVEPEATTTTELATTQAAA